jgi:1-deoxyxylulose-5-phosphate synthase
VEYRNVGSTGLKVSRICIGTMVYGTDEVDEAGAVKIIERALDVGINFFDTAQGYSGGRSEEILGKTVRKQRSSVILATKVGLNVGLGMSQVGPGPKPEIGLSRGHIMGGVEGSLRRLGTDYIDLYYAHMPDYNTPIEETLRAFDDLIHQGKVRYIGCSNSYAWYFCKARSVSELHNLARYECIQVGYNLLARDIEIELLPYCASERLGVTVFNPLAAGLLSGTHDPKKGPAKGTRFTNEAEGFAGLYNARYWSDVNFEAVSSLKQIAEEHGRNLVQFALAWILNNPTITSILCGITSLKQLELDLPAVDLKLSEEELSTCDEIWKRYFRPPRYFYARLM